MLGLDIGADDYITKPFNPIEVLARVRSQLRRYNKLGGSEDSNKKEVLSCGGVTVSYTHLEYRTATNERKEDFHESKEKFC